MTRRWGFALLVVVAVSVVAPVQARAVPLEPVIGWEVVTGTSASGSQWVKSVDLSCPALGEGTG